jgi:tRNA-modifying protein YgfZ
MTQLAALHGRAIIAVEGEDRVPFLQGLVSNDVALAVPGQAAWAAFLTPQGKYLADFFIVADAGRLLLDCEAAEAASLLQRLSRFRLRSKVSLQAGPELLVHAAWGTTPPARGIVAADPRLPDAGWRVLSPVPLPTDASEADWDRHRLALGLPDGTRDMEAEKTVLLEAGFDELNGVSWNKGCYLGQELTARTKYRGLLKRRLVPVAVDGPLPVPGTPALRDGKEVGTMRSGRGDLGLALLRLEALSDPLTCGAATLTPRIPAWMHVPAAVS